MESKDVVFLVVGIVMQLMTVVLAQQVIAKREKNNRTLQLFYDLVGHLDDFKMAFVASASHARHREEHLRRYDEYAERIQSLESTQRMTGANIHIVGKPRMPDTIDAQISALQQSIGRDDRESNEESVRTGRELRKSASALTADCLLLEMLYHAKAKSLVASLTSLKVKAEIFEGIAPDYMEVCRPIEMNLPETIERIQNEVTQFWRAEMREVE